MRFFRTALLIPFMVTTLVAGACVQDHQLLRDETIAVGGRSQRDAALQDDGSATTGNGGTGAGGGAAGDGDLRANEARAGGAAMATLTDAGFNGPNCLFIEPRGATPCLDGVGGIGSVCTYSNGEVCICGFGRDAGQAWTCINPVAGLEAGVGCPMNQPITGSSCGPDEGPVCPYNRTICACRSVSVDGAAVNLWYCP
jgi:hypothetical protein